MVAELVVAHAVTGPTVRARSRVGRWFVVPDVGAAVRVLADRVAYLPAMRIMANRRMFTSIPMGGIGRLSVHLWRIVRDVGARVRMVMIERPDRGAVVVSGMNRRTSRRPFVPDIGPRVRMVVRRVECGVIISFAGTAVVPSERVRQRIR